MLSPDTPSRDHCLVCKQERNYCSTFVNLPHQYFICDKCVETCVQIVIERGYPPDVVTITRSELDKLKAEAARTRQLRALEELLERHFTSRRRD